jgi:hypothetical protein
MLVPLALLLAAQHVPEGPPLGAGSVDERTTLAKGSGAREPQVDSDGVELAGASAGAVRVPSSNNAWGGMRTGREPTLSEHVADYDIAAVLDPERHTIKGHERLTWRNRSDRPVHHLYLHLYLNAFEGPGSTFMTEIGRYGGFRFGGIEESKEGEHGWIELRRIEQTGESVAWKFVHPDGGPETDHTVVQLSLPQPVPAGGTATLEIDFYDQLPRVVARTGWVGKFHLVGQWFPKVGVLELPGERGATRPRWNCHQFHLFSEFYADFGSYRAEITVPKGYLFGSTGVESTLPLETAEGMRHIVKQDDIHDFAFTAWDEYDAPLEGNWQNVRVKVLYGPEYAESARIALGSTIDGLEYFSRRLGPYPYRQVTVVVPPYNSLPAGGMEYETFFTTIGSIAQPVIAAVRFVTIHEFAHGYYMGILASNEAEEPFLDEGVNEFWNARELEGETMQFEFPGLLGRLGLRSPKFSQWDLERSGTQRFQADPIAGNSWMRYSGGSYGLVYARTALAFHDLEKRIGREVLERGFREYYRRWRFRHPSTADLEKALEDTAGDQAPVVRQWFEEQIYAGTPIDDRVETVEATEVVPEPGVLLQADGTRVERNEKEVKEEIRRIRQAFKKAHPHAKPFEPGPFPWRSVVQVRRYAAHVPQKLVVKFEDGSSETMRWPAEERWHHYEWERPTPIVSAQLDPDRDVLLDLNKLDDGRNREGSRLAVGRWTLELKAWVQLVLAFLEAL